MKTLSQVDKAEIQAIACVMMRMNDRNDINASQDSTYGHLWNAIHTIVANNYGIELGDINWGGNATWADDVESAMRDAQRIPHYLIEGEQSEKILANVNLGNGYASYALFKGQWYSVNLHYGQIQDVRWEASAKELEQIAKCMADLQAISRGL